MTKIKKPAQRPLTDIEQMTEEERRAYVKASNEIIQHVIINRCGVVARRAEKEGDATREAHFLHLAKVLKKCGKMAVADHVDTNDEAVEFHPKTGEVRTVQRKFVCRQQVCTRCHGRTHAGNAHGKKMISAAELAGHRFYQLVIDVPAPYSLAGYDESHDDALAKARILTDDARWKAWAMGTSCSLELTASSSTDGGPPRFHLHLLAQLHYGVETIPDDVRALISTIGTLAPLHSLVGPKKGEAARMMGYVVKGHSPKKKMSPLHGASYYVVDGLLDVTSRRGEHATFHFFSGGWKKPSPQKKKKEREPVEVATTPKAKPTTDNEVAADMAKQFRVELVVVKEEAGATPKPVANIAFRQLDSLGRRHGPPVKHVSVPVIGISG